MQVKPEPLSIVIQLSLPIGFIILIFVSFVPLAVVAADWLLSVVFRSILVFAAFIEFFRHPYPPFHMSVLFWLEKQEDM